MRGGTHHRALIYTKSEWRNQIFGGKRNESSYVLKTAAKVAEIYNLTPEEVGEMTTRNALQLFQLTPPHEF